MISPKDLRWAKNSARQDQTLTCYCWTGRKDVYVYSDAHTLGCVLDHVKLVTFIQVSDSCATILSKPYVRRVEIAANGLSRSSLSCTGPSEGSTVIPESTARVLASTGHGNFLKIKLPACASMLHMSKSTKERSCLTPLLACISAMASYISLISIKLGRVSIPVAVPIWILVLIISHIVDAIDSALLYRPPPKRLTVRTLLSIASTS